MLGYARIGVAGSLQPLLPRANPTHTLPDQVSYFLADRRAQEKRAV
jgi:hypothetical protein